MEWILQVVDEIDDAIASMRHGLIGVTASIGVALAHVGAALKIRHAAPLPALKHDVGKIL